MPENQVSTEFKEKCDEFNARLELYSLIAEGLEAEQSGKMIPFSDAIEQIRKELAENV